jgi:hypothetical protein
MQLNDGIVLVYLLDTLFDVTVRGVNLNANNNIQRMNNINFAVDGYKSVGVEVRGIGAAGTLAN